VPESVLDMLDIPESVPAKPESVVGREKPESVLLMAESVLEIPESVLDMLDMPESVLDRAESVPGPVPESVLDMLDIPESVLDIPVVPESELDMPEDMPPLSELDMPLDDMLLELDMPPLSPDALEPSSAWAMPTRKGLIRASPAMASPAISEKRALRPVVRSS
jgi:hypothetical protein